MQSMKQNCLLTLFKCFQFIMLDSYIDWYIIGHFTQCISCIQPYIIQKCDHFDHLQFHWHPLRCPFLWTPKKRQFCVSMEMLSLAPFNVPSHTIYNVLLNRSRGCGEVLWGRWLLEEHNGLPTMYRFPGWQISPQGRHEYHCAGT